MGTKICLKCKECKEINQFSKDKTNKDGLNSKCKICSKLYYIENKDHITKNRIIYKEINKVKIQNYYHNNKDKYYLYKEQNIEKIKSYDKEYRTKNKRTEYNQEYYIENKNKIIEYSKGYKINNRDKIRKYCNDRYKNDYLYNLSTNIRASIFDSFKTTLKGNFSKSKRTQEILGCTFEEFFIYLQNKFEPWMNWKNKGLYNGEFNYGWDLDHIIPISSVKTEEDIYKLNHYTNFQPLCSKVNREIKRDKLNYKKL